MVNGINLTLVLAPDEKPLDELRQLQAKGRIFRQAVRTAEQQQPGLVMDRDFDVRADGGKNVFTRFGSILSLAAQETMSPLGEALAKWIKARAGRKARMKIGDDEFEVSSVAEIEALMKLAKMYKQYTDPKRIQEL